MRVVRVTDPQGLEWQVSVRWRPRHRALVRRIGGWRRNKRKRNGLDNVDPLSGVGDGCLDDAVRIGGAGALPSIVRRTWD